MVDLVPSSNKEIPALGSSQDTIYPPGFVDSLNKPFVFGSVDTTSPVQSIDQRNMNALKYAIPNFMLGAFSEIAAAMPGVSEEDAQEFLKTSTPDSIYKNYAEHKEGANILGSLALSLVPIFGVTKLMKSEKVFNSAKKFIGEKAATGILADRVSIMDRVAKIREQAVLLAEKQQLSMSALAEPAIASSMKKAVLHEVFDSLKIGIATDIGIYAIANESDFLFPDELSAIETAAFYGVPNLIVGGVSGAFMRYSLKNVLRDIGPIADKARNSMGLPFNDLISRPGERDLSAVLHAASMQSKQAEFSKVFNDPTLEKNINSQMLERKRIVGEQIHLMAQDAVVVGVTRKIELDPSEFNTLMAAQSGDYRTLHEVVSVEKATDVGQKIKDLEKAKRANVRALDEANIEIKKQTLGTPAYENALGVQKEALKQKEFLDKLGLTKLNPDGSMTRASTVKESFDDIATGRVRKTQEGNLKNALPGVKSGEILEIEDKVLNLKTYAAKYDTARGTEIVSTNSKLQSIFPETKLSKAGVPEELQKVNLFEGLSYKGKTAAQASMRHAVEQFVLTGEQVTKLTPKINMSHLELDGILELAEKHGRDNLSFQSVLEFETQGIKNFDDLEFASLASKYRDWVTQRDAIGMAKTGALKLSEKQMPTTEEMIISLNLPNDGVTGQHPLIQLFDNLYMNQVGEFGEVFKNLDSLKETLHRITVPETGVIRETLGTAEMKLRGSQLKTFTEPRKPVLLVTKSSFVDPLHREELLGETARRRMEMVEGLRNAKNQGAPLVTMLLEEALRDPIKFKVAQASETLVDGSAIHGDQFVQTMFSVHNQPTIVAADSIVDNLDKITKGYVAQKFDAFSKEFSTILSHENVGDAHSFALLTNQQGLGWRATGELEPVTRDGKLIGYNMILEDHSINKSMFAKFYKDQEIPSAMYMPDPMLKWGDEYKPMLVTPMAAEAAMALNSISQDILNISNALKAIAHKPPLPRKPFHLTAKNLQGKEVLFLINKNTGELETVKAGNTAAQARSLADAEISAANKQGTDLFIATENEISNYHMLKLDAFEKVTDYSTTFTQTAGTKGTSFGQIIETGPEVITNMQQSMISQYQTLAKITAAMIFEPQLKQAEFGARTAVVAAGRSSKLTPAGAPGNTIQDIYINRILGRSSGNREKFIGRSYGAAEDIYDSLIQKAWDEKVAFFKGGQTEHQAKTGFDALNKATSGFQPFKDSTEFLENTMRIKTPHTMRKHVGKLNNLASLAMLRMFEIGLGLINVGALPTLIPPVAKALQRKAGEDLVSWKNRTAAWSSPISEDVAIWNPARAFTSGMHFMFSTNKAISAERKIMLDKAGEKGHLWQKTVEQMQLFTAPAEGYNEKMIKHYAELSARFVDKTEEMSRSISYGTFYHMGRKNLELGEEAAMDFAHHMANQVIGDYRPNNKPQIFQGAPGAMFGLFTTFAWNYLQRSFGYLEKGQFKAFANQMGLQAAFFGAKSLPGFSLYVDNFTSNYDGTDNLVDRLHKGLGPDFTDAFLFGGVSTLTGLSMHTRTSLGLPFSNYRQGDGPLDFAASTSYIKQQMGGIAEVVDSLKTNKGFNAQQLTEIASRTFPISGLRGVFNLGAGQTTDARGNVLIQNNRTAVEIASSLAKISSVRKQKTVEEFARQRSQQLKQAELKSSMRKAIKSAFRGGTLDGDFLNNMAKKHLQAGGEPASFGQMLKDAAFDGLIDKAYLRALETAKSQSKHKDHIRLMEIISEDNN